MITYWCSRHSEWLPADKFSISARRSTGVQSYCKECMKDYARENRRQTKNTSLSHKFGISIEEYDLLLDAQNFECAICTIDMDDVQKEFAVDHDHATGKIRGLLCERCNHGLGHFKDDIVRLQAAIDYLKEHDERLLG